MGKGGINWFGVVGCFGVFGIWVGDIMNIGCGIIC